jgi:hypothetical protein
MVYRVFLLRQASILVPTSCIPYGAACADNEHTFSARGPRYTQLYLPQDDSVIYIPGATAQNVEIVISRQYLRPGSELRTSF